jgi:hypothetical protein
MGADVRYSVKQLTTNNSQLSTVWKVASCQLLVVSGFLGLLSAQSPAPDGSLNGRVLAEGAPVRHARVVVEHATTTGATFTTSTDGSGAYHVDKLRPGLYRVRAQKPGFLMDGQESADVLRESLTAEVAPGLPATRDIRMVRGVAIEGRVVTSAGYRTGVSFSVAVDRVVSSADGGGTSGATAQRTVDEDGNFRFHTLGAGRFRLRVILGDGRPDWYYPGTVEGQNAHVFSLAAGSNHALGNFSLPSDLTPSPFTPRPGQPGPIIGGSIEGRVFDEFGDPAPWVSVQLLDRRFMAGRFRLFPRGFVGGTIEQATASESDDFGQFRFLRLNEGDYYLVALAEPFGRMPRPAEQAGLTGLAPTYSPNTEDPSQARPIRVVNGQTTSDVMLMMQSTPTGSLEVKQLDTDGRQMALNGLATLDTLFQIRHGEMQPALRVRLLTSDTVRHLPAAEYVLWSGGEAHPILVSPGSTNEIRVTGKRVSHVDALTGRLVFDGVPDFKPADAPFLRVVLETTDVGRLLSLNAQTSAAIEDDWTFSLIPRSTTGVMRANHLPHGWALARVMQGEREITDTPIQFSDPTQVLLHLTNRTGVLAGQILAGNAPTNRHGVILFSENRERWTYPSRFIRVAHVNAQGQFEISGILPGKYLAVPLPNNTDPGADPEWLDMMRPTAVGVTIAERQTTTVDLMVPR